MYIREEWVKKTEFHPVISSKVLEQVVARVKEVVASAALPVVVFDLDSTLFDVSKRSYEILRSWIEDPAHHAHQETKVALEGLKPSEMRYSLQDIWDSRKIPYTKEPFDRHFKHAKNYWRQRFFHHEYLDHDEPTDGAIDFVNKLYSMGAQIVYLTGRDIPLMGFGTFEQLKIHGLPIEVPRTRLIMKPKRFIDDLDFKTAAAQTISEMGEVVAAFENEPKNLIAMQKVFAPTTMNIFIETVSSDHPAPAGQGIFKIDQFKVQS